MIGQITTARQGAEPALRSWQRNGGYGELVTTATREILDLFERCPACGYPLQASETIRTYTRGVVERTVFRSCGMPCGWRDSATSAHAVPPAV